MSICLQKNLGQKCTFRKFFFQNQPDMTTLAAKRSIMVISIICLFLLFLGFDSACFHVYCVLFTLQIP